MPRFSVSGTFGFLLLPLLPLLWVGEWDGTSGPLLSSVEVLVSVFKSGAFFLALKDFMAGDAVFFLGEKFFFGVTVSLGETGLLGETILIGGVPEGDGF
mgnify:CR=1 FL=1